MPRCLVKAAPISVFVVLLLAGCGGDSGNDAPPPTPTATATSSPTPTATAPPMRFCDLPGSVQTTANGLVVVPGGPAGAPDLGFLHLPVGFCAHFFAKVGNTRQLRFAPGGELFVASPTRATTGNGQGGKAAIMVLADDDHDGVADTASPFLSGLPSTQALLFTGGYFYYQDDTKIMRVPYRTGDRTPSGGSEQVADITIYVSNGHWPKTLDVADDGTIYVGNGGDQSERCDPTHPFHGGILKLDGAPGGTPVAKGFRNPISVRCSRGHNLCFAAELTRDYTATQGGREKIVPIRQGDDWGFPCCATKDLPFPDIMPAPDCSGVASEDNSFIVGSTPFDLDFETGRWPAPWNNRVYVPLHGAAGNWEGARLVSIALDPVTGHLLPASDLGGEPSGALAEFATGWDDGTFTHGRPAVVAFAADGRLFLGNDANGDIIWIAPLGL
jgi:glucose/arabinose dehydrogenase